jgi:hypothetical protein
MKESAALETILSPGWPKRCDILNMHYRSCRVHISPALQNLSERLEHVLTEVATVEHHPRVDPVDKDDAPDAKSTVSIVFGAAIMHLTLVGTSSADPHYILW